jgi:hypothetical protein
MMAAEDHQGSSKAALWLGAAGAMVARRPERAGVAFGQTGTA